MNNQTNDGSSRMLRAAKLLGLSIFASGLSGCVMERTVTDGSGEVIYQDTEVHAPFESEAKKREEVQKKERELGW